MTMDMSAPLVCPECTQTFTRLSHLTRHVASKHVEGSGFVCKQCHGHFSRRDALKRHMDQYCRQSKSANNSPPEGKKPIGPCPSGRQQPRNVPSLKACDHCSQRKLKCSGSLPCERCTLEKRACSFDRPTRQRWSLSSAPTHSIPARTTPTSPPSHKIALKDTGLSFVPRDNYAPSGYFDHIQYPEYFQPSPAYSPELEAMLATNSADMGIRAEVKSQQFGGENGAGFWSSEMDAKIRRLLESQGSQHQHASFPYLPPTGGRVEQSPVFDESLHALMNNVAATSLALMHSSSSSTTTTAAELTPSPSASYPYFDSHQLLTPPAPSSSLGWDDRSRSNSHPQFEESEASNSDLDFLKAMFGATLDHSGLMKRSHE
ncbi:hypothetical protein BT69DRAFT_1283640 [Atractiella rhizophila]|nr:hypothetical protein BT69DRAFT_1283640 [Atractiella rhizophila]